MKKLILPWLLLLSACNQLGIKQEPVEVDTGPADPVEIERLADQAYNEKNWAVSEENYLKLAKKIPTEAKPWFRIGNIYAHNNRPEDAVRAYREALVRRPDFTKAWHNLGVVQIKQAAKTFNELSLHANRSSPLYGKGEEIYDGLLKLLSQEKDAE